MFVIIVMTTVGSATTPLFVPTMNYWVPYISGTTGPWGLAVADLNGDGKLDLVAMACGSSCGWFDGKVLVMLGNGDGTFASAVTYDSGGQWGGPVVVADVNGDGKPDIVVVNLWVGNPTNFDGSVGVLLGNGDGTFKPVVTYPSGGAYAESVAVTDLNGDGRPDLVVANCSVSGSTECGGTVEGNIGVLLGNGDGTFQLVVSYDSGGQETFAITAGDFNHDGKPDLAVANDGSSTVDVLLGNGDGSFLAPVPLAVSGVEALAVADLNGDGKMDLIAAGGSAVWVLMANGDGAFQPAVHYASGGYDVKSIAIADLNGDGKLDLAVANWNDPNKYDRGSVGVLLGKGDGTFQPVANYYVDAKTYANSTYVSRVAVGDLTGDGRPELVLGDRAGVSVMLNNSALEFSFDRLNTSGSPSLINEPVTFTASSRFGIPAPNGERVTFYDGSTEMGKATIANGVAIFSSSSLSAKSHDIQAIYAGDTSLKPSELYLRQVVTLYPTSTKFITTPNPSNYGQPVNLTAQVSDTSPGALTGWVSFNNGTTAVGAVQVNAEGNATLLKTALPVGTNSIHATYNGDSVNAKSASPAIVQTVNQAKITITVKSWENPSKLGKSVLFTATLTSNGGVPNGQTVGFSYNGNLLGTAKVSGGKANLFVATLPVGSDVVTATYTGDGNHSSATASLTQTVN